MVVDFKIALRTDSHIELSVKRQLGKHVVKKTYAGEDDAPRTPIQIDDYLDASLFGFAFHFRVANAGRGLAHCNQFTKASGVAVGERAWGEWELGTGNRKPETRRREPGTES